MPSKNCTDQDDADEQNAGADQNDQAQNKSNVCWTSVFQLNFVERGIGWNRRITDGNGDVDNGSLARHAVVFYQIERASFHEREEHHSTVDSYREELSV